MRNALKLSKLSHVSIKIDLSEAEAPLPTSCSRPLPCSPSHVQQPPKAICLCSGWGRSPQLLSCFFLCLLSSLFAELSRT